MLCRVSLKNGYLMKFIHDGTISQVVSCEPAPPSRADIRRFHGILDIKRDRFEAFKPYATHCEELVEIEEDDDKSVDVEEIRRQLQMTRDMLNEAKHTLNKATQLLPPRPKRRPEVC